MKPEDFSGLPCLLTKKQAAFVLGVSVRKVDKLRKTDGLRSVKIGDLVRFETADLCEFINRRKSRRPFLDASHLQRQI